MAYRQFGITVALMIALGFAFYPALWLPRRWRAMAFWVFFAAVLLLPQIILPKAKLLRLLAAVMAIMMGFRLYDRYRSAEDGFRPAWGAYALSIANPFAIVLRRALKARRPAAKSDVLAAGLGLSAGAAAIWLMIGIFRIDWASHSFVAEHCIKAVSLFLVVQFLLNGLAAASRLVGIPATDFAGPFFLARTPAEFWRFYNRPVGQFLNEYVFTPLGGPRHAVFATLVTFAFSGVMHEYLFDVPAHRILGTQMAFFLIQGLAVTATLRIRPRGWAVAPAILLTFAFNLLTARLFLAALNAVVPFYVIRS
ncbi:MAG TPA: MBOAT family O-acyltransferase [Tepidisphaeraceae bacterium]|jgi:D-alanyl-lipoteichoic acid acyltransferase DltB (MBOAT superfamily)